MREDLEHLALLTLWVGDVDTSAVDVLAFDSQSGGFPTVVDEPLTPAAGSGAR